MTSQLLSAEAIAVELDEVRQRSLDLLEPLPDDVLVRQHSPLMSPLAWDLGHVANYEELWLLRALSGEPALRPELDDLYDAFRHPRRDRHALPIPGPAEAKAYGQEVRARVLDLLSRTELDPDVPLLADGFVYRMVVQHEHQHDETMLAAIQLLPAPGYRPGVRPGGRPGLRPGVRPGGRPGLRSAAAGDRASRSEGSHGEVLLPGGKFAMGTSTAPSALDNERPLHHIDLEPFWLDTTPVTNRAYAEYLTSTGAEPPQAWSPDGAGGWVVNHFGWTAEPVADEPVQHVSWHEATAFALWAGKRLPTEAEWEFAASDGGQSSYPWGHLPPGPALAALWYDRESAFGPGPVGTHPAGANSWGVQDLIGGVWEWTSSDFGGHPGFVAFPYPEYSEVFFGPEYKVLRGGSWATHPSAMRATFRNWDYPIRRQIFSGFRCARDA